MAKSTMAIVLLVFAAALPAALADANFVARTCKSSDNPQCVAVLRSDRRSVNATTVRELASIGLDIAAATARDSASYISGEADRLDRTNVGDALNECLVHYRQAVNELETARESFDAGAFSDAEKETGAAEDAGDRCEQAFSERRLRSTVSDVDRRTKDRTSVASDLIDLLWTVKRSGRRLLRA